MMTHLRRLFRKSTPLTRRERVRVLLEQTEPDPASLDREECYLLSNILALHMVTAEEVMVPRAEIQAVGRDMGLKDFGARVAKAPFTRFVVYGDDLDDVRGFVRVKDICPFLEKGEDFSLKAITRKILFVSPARPVLHLLMQMRVSQTPMAIVVDEMGGVDGLVTYGDIVRKIVGDIDDVSLEDTQPQLLARPDGTFEADARLPIEALTQEFGLTLSDAEKDDDVDTVGGLIVSFLGRVPDRLEVLVHPSGLEFEVLEVNPRRVLKVRMRRVTSQKTPG